MAKKLEAPFVLCIALLAVANVGQAGQVAVDNSFGPGGSLSGPNYSIPDMVGKTAGNNLFHSFSQFNLGAGDVATFSGPASIQNVISRVTGVTPSTIDGTIQCTIVGANFFLINPFGVMFGPNASVDVSGSFAVTTADYVKLADGGRFDARNPANDILTTAPVSAFGFLGPTVSPITIQGPSADVESPMLTQLADGKTFLVVGGDLLIENVQISVPSGRIALISVGSASELIVDIDNPSSSIDTSSFAVMGNVELTTFATLEVSGDPGGRIDIQSHNLTMRETSIGASSLGLEDGLGVDFNVRDAITLRGGTGIFLDTSNVGAAGGLSMTAKSIALLGEVDTDVGSVNIVANTIGSGKAGDITLHADNVVIQNGVLISAGTGGPGNGANIDVIAKSIVMAGQQSTVFLSTTSFEGKAGNITIQTDSLTLEADSQITAEAFGPNPAGSIRITAKEIIVDDAGGSPDGFAGISVNSETSGFTSGLGAGGIIINTDTLNLRNGARVSSGSATDSPGGGIIMNASHEIRLADSEITTRAGGDGGNVHLTTPFLVYLLNSRITAESVNGNGGNITIDPRFVILNGSSLIASATIGNGGNVDVVSDFFLQSGSVIDVSSEFGLQGSVTIAAPDAELSGSVAGLTAELLGAETLLRPHCAERLPGGASSFTVLDRGGVPVGPETLLPAVQSVGSDTR